MTILKRGKIQIIDGNKLRVVTIAYGEETIDQFTFDEIIEFINSQLQSKIQQLEAIVDKAEKLTQKKYESNDTLVYISLYDYGELQQAIAEYKKGE